MQIIQHVTSHCIMSYQNPSLSSKVVKAFHEEILSLANHHSLGTYNAVFLYRKIYRLFYIVVRYKISNLMEIIIHAV